MRFLREQGPVIKCPSLKERQRSGIIKHQDGLLAQSPGQTTIADDGISKKMTPARRHSQNIICWLPNTSPKMQSQTPPLQMTEDTGPSRSFAAGITFSRLINIATRKQASQPAGYIEFGQLSRRWSTYTRICLSKNSARSSSMS